MCAVVGCPPCTSLSAVSDTDTALMLMKELEVDLQLERRNMLQLQREQLCGQMVKMVGELATKLQQEPPANGV